GCTAPRRPRAAGRAPRGRAGPSRWPAYVERARIGFGTVPATEPPDPGGHPRLAVITVAYRSDDVLRQLLDSLPAATAEPLAVVVVDNLPGEGAAAALAAAAGARYVA